MASRHNDRNNDVTAPHVYLILCALWLQKKVRMGSTNFNSLEALIVHFSDTNLPNKTTPLTKAHSYYIRP